MGGLRDRLVTAAIGALVGVVVTGAGAYLTWAKDIQSREDVIAIVETHNPYLVDRQLIADAVQEIKHLRSDMRTLNSKIVALETELRLRRK